MCASERASCLMGQFLGNLVGSISSAWCLHEMAAVCLWMQFFCIVDASAAALCKSKIAANN